MKSISGELKVSGTSSVFASKKVDSSNSTFVAAAASNTAVSGSQAVRVNQLAKNDIVMSQDLTSTANSSVITSAGTHNFVITAGDGSGGTFTSTVSVTFAASDFTAGAISNQKVMETIERNQQRQTTVLSFCNRRPLSSGSFTLNLTGFKQINYSAGTSARDGQHCYSDKFTFDHIKKIVNSSITN